MADHTTPGRRAPGHGILDRVAFPPLRTFDSSRTPKRGERIATPRTLAEVDLSAITAALAAAETADTEKPGGQARPQSEDRRHLLQLEEQLAAANARIADLEQEDRELKSRLADIGALAAASSPVAVHAKPSQSEQALPAKKPVQPPSLPLVSDAAAVAPDVLHPAARKLLSAAARHAPARFTWGQLATLAGLKPSGGHFNAGRKDLRLLGYVAESNGLVIATAGGLEAAGEVPPVPSTPAERLALWCGRLPSPAPEILRTLAAQGECYMDADELAAALAKKPSGGHWNSGIAVLRNNGLIEADGRRYRTAPRFRE
jgi:uncharacterized protein